MSYFINPLWVNFGSMYLQYYQFIDAALALIIFLSMTQWVFQKKFNKDGKNRKEATMLSLAISLALTFGFVVFEMRTSFKFGDLDGLAVLIFLLIVGVFLYELLLALLGEERKKYAFSIAYVILYAIFLLPFSKVFTFLYTQYPFVWSFFGVGYLVCVIILIIGLFGLFKGKGGNQNEKHSEPTKQPETQKNILPPLSINVKIPPPNKRADFKRGDEVQIAAEISAATEKTVWTISIDSERIGAGMGAVANVSQNGILEGEHKITITADDAERHDKKEFAIVVNKPESTPNPEKEGTIDGYAINEQGKHLSGVKYYLALAKQEEGTAQKFIPHPNTGGVWEAKTFLDRDGNERFVFEEVPYGAPVTVVAMIGNRQGVVEAENHTIVLTNANKRVHDVKIIFKTYQAQPEQKEIINEKTEVEKQKHEQTSNAKIILAPDKKKHPEQNVWNGVPYSNKPASERDFKATFVMARLGGVPSDKIEYAIKAYLERAGEEGNMKPIGRWLSIAELVGFEITLRSPRSVRSKDNSPVSRDEDYDGFSTYWTQQLTTSKQEREVVVEVGNRTLFRTLGYLPGSVLVVYLFAKLIREEKYVINESGQRVKAVAAIRFIYQPK